MDEYHDTRQKRQKLCQETENVQCPSDREQELNEHTSHFPINRLPKDVVSEIFVQCLPEIQRSWPACAGRSASDIAPLLLCNVCSSWRALALATPRLWQRLFLKFTETMPKSKEKEDVVSMTHAWIKRSGALPLTLSLYFKTTNPNYFRGDFQALARALLDALTLYTSRWEHVQLRYSCLPITLPKLGDMPSLLTFGVVAPGFHRLLMTPSRGEAQFPLASCPKLARIFWPFKIAISEAPLQCTQLTYINLLEFTSSQEALFVIRSCPNLKNLKIWLFDLDVHESLSREVVVNRRLQKLQLRVYTHCGRLIRRLGLPSLADVSFCFDNPASTLGFHKELMRFFSTSRCRLKRLRLHDCRFDDAALLECLKHRSCAGLTQLEISSIINRFMFTDTVLLALTNVPLAENGWSVLLPRLAHLSLARCFGGTSSRLGTMILSRCISEDKKDQLQTLSLLSPGQGLGKRDMALIRLAERQGLQVTICG